MKKSYKFGWIKWDDNGDFVCGQHKVFGKAEKVMLLGSSDRGSHQEVFAYERIFFSKVEDEDGISELNIEGYFNRADY